MNKTARDGPVLYAHTALGSHTLGGRAHGLTFCQPVNKDELVLEINLTPILLHWTNFPFNTSHTKKMPGFSRHWSFCPSVRQGTSHPLLIILMGNSAAQITSSYLGHRAQRILPQWNSTAGIIPIHNCSEQTINQLTLVEVATRR